MTEFLPRSLQELALDFPKEIDHISASSINMALRCEEQWRQVYILKRRKPPSLAMLAGRADHKKIVTGDDLPVEDVREAFVQAMEESVDESGGLGEILTGGDDYSQIRRTGQDIVAGYHREVSPTVQPVMVEHEFRHQVEGLPVEILGYIDIVAEADRIATLTDTTALNFRIIDRKRSGRETKVPSPDWQLQAGIYQLNLPYVHQWHVSVTTRVPKYQTTLVQPVPNAKVTEHVLRDAVLKLGFLYQRYGPDEAWPVTGKTHTWACGYCGFKDDCWGWADDRTVVV
jgi:CRISPR/Cas system-associated exonuclease Cas4 (RecB family)